MTELTAILHAGDHSLVLRTATGEIYTFDRRGVADLHALYHDPSHPLAGADTADKVVGMGAAALMIAGGVRRCHTDVISTDALRLFRANGVECTFDHEVPIIINRTGTGRCPLETRLAPLHGISVMLPEIDRFVAEMAERQVNS